MTGPITGGDRGQPFSAMAPADLTQAGCTEALYFFGGSATAFKAAGPLGLDGAWADGGANTGAQEAAPGAARNFCFLFGHTKLFDAATLTSLYPTHDAFREEVHGGGRRG